MRNSLGFKKVRTDGHKDSFNIHSGVRSAMQNLVYYFVIVAFVISRGSGGRLKDEGDCEYSGRYPRDLDKRACRLSGGSQRVRTGPRRAMNNHTDCVAILDRDCLSLQGLWRSP